MNDTTTNAAQASESSPENHISKPRDWRIRDLYRDSWQIVKKHKVLWLFGMALGAGGYSSSSSINDTDIESIQKFFQNGQQSSNQDLSMVLGAATSSYNESFGILFAAIPPYLYIIAVIEIIILLIATVIISIVYRSWAEAGLLEGLQTAIANGSVGIRETSEKALHTIAAIALLRIVPLLLFLLIVFVVLLIPILTFSVLGPFAPLIIFVSILFFAFVFLMINFSQIWAVRKVVIEKIPAKQALREGYHISLKKFWSMLWLGILNTLLSFLISFIFIIPIAGFMLGGIVTIQKDVTVGTILLIAGTISAMLFILGSEIINGLTTVFKNSVWSLAYRNIQGKYDK